VRLCGEQIKNQEDKMPSIKKIVECVPNFSEGRDLDKLEKILEPFRGKEGVKLLDCQNDEDHNRAVVTVVGEPEPLKAAVIESMGVAVEVIDMRRHQGQHPRMGAVDVVPFIPVKNISLEETIEISRDVAAQAARRYDLPIYLYEKSASKPQRQNLAAIRKGQFEGMAAKIRQPDWKPDFGPDHIHPSAGVTAVGARMPLVAYNVNLDTNNLDIADRIAKQVRHISGGLRYCKALGIELKDRGLVQVSMNMTDYSKTALYRVFELIKIEARRYGVNVVGSEIVGLVPMEALIDTAAYYLGLEGFSMEQVLEARIWE
jgi:glutamate formiminotransferase